jgi:peroxiredoxin
MNVIVLLARVVLTIVFAVAGLAKLADRRRSPAMFAEFGVSARLASPLAAGLPLVELGVAAALLAGPTAWWGAMSALILLFGFSIVIAANLVRGRAPQCRCFGQVSAKPIGITTLARNAVLAALAAVVVAYGRDAAGAGTVGWVLALSITDRIYAVITAVVLGVLVLEGWLLINLLAQNGRLALRLDALEQTARTVPGDPPQGLPAGTSAPAFALPDIDGNILTLDSLRAAGKPVVLLFIDPDCGPCNALLPDVAGWQRQTAHFTFASISRGALERNRASAHEHGLARVLVQHDTEVMQSYQVSATPSVVVVNSDGAIADFPAMGDIAIRGVLARLLAERTPSSTPLTASESAVHEDVHYHASPGVAGPTSSESEIARL